MNYRWMKPLCLLSYLSQAVEFTQQRTQRLVLDSRHAAEHHGTMEVESIDIKLFCLSKPNLCVVNMGLSLVLKVMKHNLVLNYSSSHS